MKMQMCKGKSKGAPSPNDGCFRATPRAPQNRIVRRLPRRQMVTFTLLFLPVGLAAGQLTDNSFAGQVD